MLAGHHGPGSGSKVQNGINSNLIQYHYCTQSHQKMVYIEFIKPLAQYIYLYIMATVCGPCPFNQTLPKHKKLLGIRKKPSGWACPTVS